MYYSRKIEGHLRRLFRQYPVVTITGPRQSGKTTLCKKVFPKAKYVNLENLDVRRRASSDPNQFLEQCPPGTIIDEIQRAPDLFSYIQTLVDDNGDSGQFILTGSAQFELMDSINQSLAGRTALLKLLPFTLDEAYLKRKSAPKIDELLFKGFFPRIFDKHLNPQEAMSFYVSTYLERDVRKILNVKDLSLFESFIKLCGGQSGQITNFSSIGDRIGVQHNTARSWVSILEASFLLYKLKPHSANFRKRLVKSPKLYLTDTSLMCFLLGIQNPLQLQNHPLKGALFETFVISELLKYCFNRNQSSNLYYWRDNNGREIDIIMDFGTTVVPVEIKSGKTINADFFKNLIFYQKLNPACKKMILIYGGDSSFIENNTYIISYKDINLLQNLDYQLNITL